jgi:hypothetical protein
MLHMLLVAPQAPIWQACCCHCCHCCHCRLLLLLLLLMLLQVD